MVIKIMLPNQGHLSVDVVHDKSFFVMYSVVHDICDGIIDIDVLL